MLSDYDTVEIHHLVLWSKSICRSSHLDLALTALVIFAEPDFQRVRSPSRCRYPVQHGRSPRMASLEMVVLH
jgi:hypothetical protein